MGKLVIDITPDLENRLQEEAAKQGLTVGDYVRALLERQVLPQGERAAPPLSAEERAARVKALRGSLTHVPFSTEDLSRQKREEIELEERRWENRLR